MHKGPAFADPEAVQEILRPSRRTMVAVMGGLTQPSGHGRAWATRLAKTVVGSRTPFAVAGATWMGGFVSCRRSTWPGAVCRVLNSTDCSCQARVVAWRTLRKCCIA